MAIVLFEDHHCEDLAPITLGRLAAMITCGSLRLVDIVERLGVPTYGISRPYLEWTQRHDVRSLKILGDDAQDLAEQPSLLLNARLVPSIENFYALRELLSSGAREPTVVWDRQQIAAIVAPPVRLQQLQGEGGMQAVAELLKQAAHWTRDPRTLSTFQAPHEVVSQNMAILRSNLEERIRWTSDWTEQRDGVFVGPKVDIGEYVLFETQSGPIVIEEGAKIGPYTLLRGPLYIGRKCKILEHAAIKDQVSLGHTTKIGGEVEASVVEPYSNKQHHGFLGHSYLGSWINLGAGTCNSDLKNTYGTVNMDYSHGKVATGMQFLGCIMGDYSKTAINTGIFTGKVIGVCSMMYGFVTSNVPSFVNYARLFGQLATLPPEVMIATQSRMFSRRQVEQRDGDQRLIHDMYRITQAERDRFGDALAL